MRTNKQLKNSLPPVVKFKLYPPTKSLRGAWANWMWAIAVTRFNQENKAVDALMRLQLPSRLFKLNKELVRRGCIVRKLLPAFPRYVFVQPQNAWRRILDIPYIVDFVRSALPGEHDEFAPAMLSHDVIVDLEKRSDHEFVLFGDDRAPTLIKRFQFGDEVRITNKLNSFALFPAKYHDLNTIIVNLFGRDVMITVDEADLELVEAKKRNRRGGRRGRAHMRS